MWTYYPDLLSTPVPRYTSYPTAAEFHDEVGELEQRMGLAAIGRDEPVSLYLHIPFCKEICWYCGCNTGRANRQDQLTRYLTSLTAELALVAERLDGRGKIERIAFGGGSPDAIQPDQFLELLETLRSRFCVSSQTILSVELDPRCFDASFAEALARAQVTRASLGVQTFDPMIQNAIGRVQSFRVVETSVRQLREAGVSSLNFDLMYGLPRQDEAKLLDSIHQSEDLGADRLAVFGYAHVPHLVPRQRRIDADELPTPAQRFRMAEAAYSFLTGRGWQSVGFDHFARPEDPLAVAARENRVRRNFQGFTDDPCDVLIGFGASAISRLPGVLVQNEKNGGSYAKRVALGKLPGVRGINLSPTDEAQGRIIERLLCQGSITLEPERRNDPLPLDALAPFFQRGLASWNGKSLQISDSALPYARVIAACFDKWRAGSPVPFSSAI